MFSQKILPALVVLGVCVQPAFSQVILQESPGFMVIPSYPVVTRRWVRTVTPPTTVRMMIISQPEVVPRTIESSAVFAPNIGVISDFRHRLDNLRDQIALGQSKGLMTADAAAALTARYDGLIGQLNGKTMLTIAENDSLEGQINLLNQDVSHAMGQ